MEEAAEWLAALDAGTTPPQAFDEWRAADPRRAVAFAQVADAFDQVARLRVVHDRAPVSQPTFNRRRMLRAGVLAGGASVAAAFVAVRAAARDHAETAVGERRLILLEDGTRVRLNTATRISWRVEGKNHAIWLEQGEIGLDVARPAGASVTLKAGGTTFRLTEGRYNVRRDPESLGLLVLSGRAEADGDAKGRVEAGGFARVIDRQMSVRPAEPVALDRARSWKDGQLVFEGESLDFVVAEFNRYRDQKMVIADPSLSRIRLGGRFTTTDPKDLLTALHASFGIRAVHTQSGAITLTAG